MSYFNGWNVVELRKIKYSDNTDGFCGEEYREYLPDNECYSIEVEWSYEDLNNDGYLELIENKIEKRWIKESDTTVTETYNYFILKGMKLIPYKVK